LDAFKALIHSIRHDDYNWLPLLPLVPFNLMFGTGRLSYVLSIANLYAFPTILLFVFLFKSLMTRNRETGSTFLSFITCVTLAFLPQFWIPILHGWPDVVGVLIIAIIILITFEKPLERQSTLRLVAVGFLLALAVMMRRWYAYWVVSFLLALTLERLIYNFREHGFKIKNYLPFAGKVFLIGTVSLLLFFSIATPIAKRMLVTNYADIYSAFKTYDSVTSMLMNYFGPTYMFFFALGTVQSLLNKKTQYISFFFLIQFITVVLLFARVQNFDRQHIYLIIPALVFFVSLSISDIIRRLRTALYKTVLLLCFIGILGLNFSYGLIPEAPVYLKRLEPLFTRIRYYPVVRNDLNEMTALLNVVKDLCKTQNDSVYVLSSSTILNDDMLRTACLLGNQGMCRNILGASHVDKRDGFPKQFLDAKYIILADPIQYHLRPEDQRVVGVLAARVGDPNSIGSSYEKLPYEFRLDNNVKVCIYEKKKPFKCGDLDNLSQMFLTYYPDKEDMFRIQDNLCRN